MKLFNTFLVLVLLETPLLCQSVERHTVSGYVREVVSEESLIGVNIYLSDHKNGTVTNNYGFYSLTIPSEDSVGLVFSYVGFATEIIRVPLNKDLMLFSHF